MVGKFLGKPTYRVSVLREFEGTEILSVYATYDDFFLCLHSDFREVSRWVCAKIELETLYRLADGSITINKALLQNNELYVAEAQGGSTKYDVKILPNYKVKTSFLAEPGTTAEMNDRYTLLNDILQFLIKRNDGEIRWA